MKVNKATESAYLSGNTQLACLSKLGVLIARDSTRNALNNSK